MYLFLCKNCLNLIQTSLKLKTVNRRLTGLNTSYSVKILGQNSLLQGTLGPHNEVFKVALSTITKPNLEHLYSKKIRMPKKKAKQKSWTGDNIGTKELGVEIQNSERNEVPTFNSGNTFAFTTTHFQKGNTNWALLEEEPKLLEVDLCEFESLYNSNSNVEEKTDFHLERNLISLELQNPEIHEEVLQEEIMDTDESKKPEPLKTESNVRPKKVPSKKLGKKEIREAERKVSADARRNLIFESHLHSFLDVCIRNGEIRQAHNTLMLYLWRQKARNPATCLYNCNVYNVLLKLWASKGDLPQTQFLLRNMEKANVSLNFQSYLYWLECLSRQTTFPSKEVLIEVNVALAAMKSQELSPEDIFLNTSYLEEQKKYVLRVLKTCIPNFKPSEPKFPIGYNTPLLQNLNQAKEVLLLDENENDCTVNDLKMWSSIQMAQEIEGQVIVKSILNDGVYNTQAVNLKAMVNECESLWRNQVTKALERNMRFLQNENKNKKGMCIYPYLSVLPLEAIVELIMNEIKFLSRSEVYGMSTHFLHKHLAMKIMLRNSRKSRQVDGYADNMLLLYSQYLRYCTDEKLRKEFTAREYWQFLLTKNNHENFEEYQTVTWPNDVLIDIGKFLCDIIMRDLKVNSKIFSRSNDEPNYIPAFYNIFCQTAHTRREEIRPHPVMTLLYRESNSEKLEMETSFLPMLCPPLPWTRIKSGNFLLSGGTFIRIADFNVGIHQRILDSTPNQDLYPVFDSLNSVSLCSWTINKPILDIIIDVFKNGGSQEMKIPRHPSCLPPPPVYSETLSTEERREVKRKRFLHRREKSQMYSLWCDALYKISIANHFRDRTFWFPHNLDFRGRFYPTPPHFNHLGSDLVRSVLLFSKGKPLGEKGLDWLKIHLINLTGIKKSDSIEKRLQYANEVLPDILDSADNPFTGKKWWQQSDDPWQTLACCQQVAEAIRSGNPSEYVCHFPVHQDGSCNGLQHYAALGRDQQGAEKVNLTPSKEPQDVYSGIADLVRKECVKDAANGNETANILEDVISRKIVKQTVMTVVYGVTNFGARLQILKRLRELPNFPAANAFPASLYLVQKTFLSIGELFSSTKLIQDWLTECAGRIARERGMLVQWITPLGLPVVQSYFRIDKKKPGMHFYPGCEQPQPNTRKQRNGFPPNFIHSLDSTHMMLTSLHCQRNDVDFVAVHDCFWTHPISVEAMNKICREQFVALHSEPLLENLSEFFMKEFSFTEKEISEEKSIKNREAMRQFNHTLSYVPQKGTLKLEEILQSVYFFS